MNDFLAAAVTEKPLIVAVDDLPANLHVLAALLKRDFRLKTATSGSSALALFEQQGELPKLLIVDVKMPGMSGIELLRRMRALPRTAGIPVILVSADASEQYETSGLQLGADDYLVKPVYRDTLIIRVRNLIARSEERQQLRLAGYVFNFSGEAITIADGNNTLVDVNAAFIKLSGYSKAEVVGRHPALLGSSRNSAEHQRELAQRVARDGYWQGEQWQTHKDGSVHPTFMTVSVMRDRVGDIEYYLTSSVDISQFKESERRIAHLAHHDALTGLPNRLHLQRYLEQAILIARRTSEQLAVMFLDLDRFKNVNDTLGHAIGDALLVEVAARLQSCIRDYDVVARLGGDEFVVILRGPDILSDAIGVAKKLNLVLNQPFLLGATTLRSAASIGIALYPDHADSMDELMRNADTSMYFAKADGGNAFRFFSPSMNAGAHERLHLEGQLYEAIERQEFELHFQVQVNARGGAVGAEALLRWRHPQRGYVAPGAFIPLAEESGLIMLMGNWVLDQACAQLKRWESHPRACRLVLAVNVSARQFRQPDFVEQVTACVQRHGIVAGRLKLEITESLTLKNVDEVIDIIKRLRTLGIGFALDDFGTGYSCLQYLKRLPVQQLKIDRSFVTELVYDSSDQAIVRTIIAMARNLDLQIIAEGVETAEQRQILASFGCDYYQGYLYGRPLDISAFEASLGE
ncbi:putative bifunctional diguanylate cyclase/phosphodiesterase [Massilia sp. PWRC2]|uniref:putative bifunctional diguanylate cyclase/phosphodiesterase n=1 Tax=Massilia sp. PWRC2 TaxID=2804626 RepID=UPI003CF54FB5